MRHAPNNRPCCNQIHIHKPKSPKSNANPMQIPCLHPKTPTQISIHQATDEANFISREKSDERRYLQSSRNGRRGASNRFGEGEATNRDGAGRSGEVASRIAATPTGANRRGSASSPEQIAAARGASRDRASRLGEGRRRGNETLRKEEVRFPIFQQYQKSGTSSSETEAVMARRHTRCQSNTQKIRVPRQAKTHVCPLAFLKQKT